MPSQPTQLESILMHAWMRRGILAWILLPLSLLFRLLVAVRSGLYRNGFLNSSKLHVPVVVVGNIFVGGTGKTPLTIWLVDALRRAGYVPGVIARGYGAQLDKLDTPRAVSAQASAQDVGDEPLLIAMRAQCPVMVGRNRVATAQALLLAHPEVTVIVSDDGLQHYALQRDIEIVLSDARGVGNGWMLPAGPLREPGTRRRDFTVINAAQFLPDVATNVLRMELLGDMAERLCDGTQRRLLTEMAHTIAVNNSPPRITAAAGIGNPARFFTMLRAAGLDFQELPLPDHYDFLGNPFADVTADIILITEKDAVKCRHIEPLKNDPRLWVVPVTARIDGALDQQIVEKLRGRSTA